MASNAVLGKGVQLKRGDGASPETFSLIPEMLSISEAPDSTKDLVDVTNHDSGDNREYILGLGDGNEIQCEFNYTDPDTGGTQQDGLRDDKDNDTARNFQLLFPMFSPDLLCSFTGLVRKVTPIPGLNEAIKLQVTIKVTGDAVWA